MGAFDDSAGKYPPHPVARKGGVDAFATIDMGDPRLDAVWAFWRAVAPEAARLAEAGIAALKPLHAPVMGAVNDFGFPPPRRDFRTLRRRRKLRYVIRRR